MRSDLVFSFSVYLYYKYVSSVASVFLYLHGVL